jgi:phosphate starvation-inducible PhoH-like protein
MKEKLDPYMQPLYDALRDMLPNEKLEDYILKGIYTNCLLAFMRGTLISIIVILDEAQNTTHSQMKMFLTRIKVQNLW